VQGIDEQIHFTQGCLENLWGLEQIKNVGTTDTASQQALEYVYYIGK